MLNYLIAYFMIGWAITLVPLKAIRNSSSDNITLLELKERGLYDTSFLLHNHEDPEKSPIISPEEECRGVYTLNACNQEKLRVKVDSIRESTDFSKGCFSIAKYFGTNKPCYEARYVSNGIRFTVTQGQAVAADIIIMENTKMLDNCFLLITRNTEVTFCLKFKNILWSTKGFRGCIYTHVKFIIRSPKNIRIHCIELRKGNSTSLESVPPKTETVINNTALNCSTFKQEPFIVKSPPLFVGILDLDSPKIKVGNITREKLQESEKNFISMGKHLIFLPYNQESNTFSPTFPTMSITSLNKKTKVNQLDSYENGYKSPSETKKGTNYFKMSKIISNKSPVFILQLPSKNMDYEGMPDYGEKKPVTEVKHYSDGPISKEKGSDITKDLLSTENSNNTTTDLLTTVQPESTINNQSELDMSKKLISKNSVLPDYLLSTPPTKSVYDSESSIWPEHLKNYKEYITTDSIVSMKKQSAKKFKKTDDFSSATGYNSLSNWSIDLGQTNISLGQLKQPGLSQEFLSKSVDANRKLPHWPIYYQEQRAGENIFNDSNTPGKFIKHTHPSSLSPVTTGGDGDLIQLQNYTGQPIEKPNRLNVADQNTPEKNRHTVHHPLTHKTGSGLPYLSQTNLVEQKENLPTAEYALNKPHVERTYRPPSQSINSLSTTYKNDNVLQQQLIHPTEKAIFSGHAPVDQNVPHKYNQGDYVSGYSSIKSDSNDLPHLKKYTSPPIAKPIKDITNYNKSPSNEDIQLGYPSGFPALVSDSGLSQSLKQSLHPTVKPTQVNADDYKISPEKYTQAADISEPPPTMFKSDIRYPTLSTKYNDPKDRPIKKASKKNTPKQFRKPVVSSSSSKKSKSHNAYPLWPIKPWKLGGTQTLYVTPHIQVGKRFPRNPAQFSLNPFGTSANHLPYWPTQPGVPIVGPIMRRIVNPDQNVDIVPKPFRKSGYSHHTKTLSSGPIYSWKPEKSATPYGKAHGRQNQTKIHKLPVSITGTNSGYTFKPLQQQYLSNTPDQFIQPVELPSSSFKTSDGSIYSNWPMQPAQQGQNFAHSGQSVYPYTPMGNERGYWPGMENQINYPSGLQFGYPQENPTNTNYRITTPDYPNVYSNSFPARSAEGLNTMSYYGNLPLPVQPGNSQQNVPGTTREGNYEYTPTQPEINNQALAHGSESKASPGSHIVDGYSKPDEGFNNVLSSNQLAYPDLYSEIPSRQPLSVLPGYSPWPPYNMHPTNLVPPIKSAGSENSVIIGPSNTYPYTVPGYDVQPVDASGLPVSPLYSPSPKDIPDVTTVQAYSSTLPSQSEHSSYPNMQLADYSGGNAYYPVGVADTGVPVGGGYNVYQSGASENSSPGGSAYVTDGSIDGSWNHNIGSGGFSHKTHSKDSTNSHSTQNINNQLLLKLLKSGNLLYVGTGNLDLGLTKGNGRRNVISMG